MWGGGCPYNDLVICKDSSDCLATECLNFCFFAILVHFAFKFWYKQLTLYREWYQKYISVKISFSSKIITYGFDAFPSSTSVIYHHFSATERKGLRLGGQTSNDLLSSQGASYNRPYFNIMQYIDKVSNLDIISIVVYKDDNSQIPRNSSVIVARIPIGGKSL